MNSKERVMNRLQGKAVDRAPNTSLIMSFAPRYINRPASEFFLDYRVLVESSIRTNIDFGIDVMSTISDSYREAYDFGAKIDFPYDSLPVSKEHFIETYDDLKKLKVFDPYESTRMLDRIRAVELFKKDVGNDYPVMGWVECPLAEAGDLRGVNEILYDFYDEPEMIKELMDICLDAGISCAKAQIKAGADIIGMGDAVASLIGRKFYQEFAYDYEKKLIAAVHEMGALAKLHICGNITDLMDDIKSVGADIVDIDWMVDYKTSCAKLKGKASICGNIDPVRIIRSGTPEIIRKAVRDCLDAGDETSFISSGCEIPVGTPHENLLAVSQALVEYGGYHNG
ncbi:MAG: uroporphyrinogen decarboxylase family protein [Eubacteriales bacterium]